MRLPLILATISLLAACASGTTQYYRLPDSSPASTAATERQTAFLQVRLKNSLNNGSLVYQTSPVQVHFARQHQWADDLSSSIATVLANRSSRNNNRYQYLAAGTAHAATRNLPTLTLEINHFEGSYHGHTRIAGQFYLTDASGSLRLQPQHFEIDTPQHGDGYAAMVESLSVGLAELARQLP